MTTVWSLLRVLEDYINVYRMYLLAYPQRSADSATWVFVIVFRVPEDFSALYTYCTVCPLHNVAFTTWSLLSEAHYTKCVAVFVNRGK